MSIRLPVFMILALCALWGCSDEPATWARELLPRLKCGMSVAEVGQLADRQIIALDPRRDWATHQIGGETSQTVVWLIFDADRLQSAQLAWAYKLKRMHQGPRTDLCKS